MAYRADFTRYGVQTISCNGVTLPQTGKWEYLICAAVLDANPDLPDDEVHFWDDAADERKTPMHCFTGASLHAMAEKVRNGFKKVLAEGEEAPRRRERPVKIAAEKNENAPQRKRLPKGEKRILVTTGEQEAIQIAFRYNTKAWNELNGRTIGCVIRKGWVEVRAGVPCVTEAGEAVAASYDIHRPAGVVMPKAAANAEPISVDMSDVKKAHWTDGQKEAFKIALRGSPISWQRNVHGKTKRVMMEFAWVTISQNGAPSVTESGIQQAILNGVPVK